MVQDVFEHIREDARRDGMLIVLPLVDLNKAERGYWSDTIGAA
jgi:hypothetical protein